MAAADSSLRTPGSGDAPPIVTALIDFARRAGVRPSVMTMPVLYFTPRAEPVLPAFFGDSVNRYLQGVYALESSTDRSRYLNALGASLEEEIPPRKRKSFLVNAIRNGNLRLARQMWYRFPEIRPERDWQKEELFVQAAYGPNPDILEWLLTLPEWEELKADPPVDRALRSIALDDDEYDDISTARAPIFTWLVEHGAHPEVAFFQLFNPANLEWIITTFPDVNLSFDDPDPDPHNDGRLRPLQFYASKGQVDMMKVLLAHGVPINEPDPLHHTALFEAMLHGRAEATEYLTAQGAVLRPDELEEVEGEEALDEHEQHQWEIDAGDAGEWEDVGDEEEEDDEDLAAAVQAHFAVNFPQFFAGDEEA